ncbi:hypothetical protein Purlil1_2141 [Purpureocillium lilacinum]|uniref:Uncharacterized protein n=1 Tax=Purpureocillium lilacinum TaxID=33203 RepID=A0ABR0CCB8_PURLI|nr:hypothetical protein Purlil1_2141 [Purpureocillium lilacinum]
MLPSISQRTVHVGGRSPRPGLQPLSRIAAAQGKQPAAWRRPRSSPQKLHPRRLSQSYSTYSYVETRMLLPVSRARHQKKLLQRRLRGQRPAPEGRNKARGGPGGHLDGSGRMEQNVGIECLRVLCLFACLSVCPTDRYGAASQETKEHRTSSSDARPSPPALHSLSSRIRFHLHEQAPPPRLVLPPPFSHSHDPPDPTGAAPSTAASPRCEPGINLGKSALDFFLIFPKLYPKPRPSGAWARAKQMARNDPRDNACVSQSYLARRRIACFFSSSMVLLGAQIPCGASA